MNIYITTQLKLSNVGSIWVYSKSLATVLTSTGELFWNKDKLSTFTFQSLTFIKNNLYSCMSMVWSVVTFCKVWGNCTLYIMNKLLFYQRKQSKPANSTLQNLAKPSHCMLSSGQCHHGNSLSLYTKKPEIIGLISSSFLRTHTYLNISYIEGQIKVIPLVVTSGTTMSKLVMHC